jgi:hypothetical protein
MSEIIDFRDEIYNRGFGVVQMNIWVSEIIDFRDEIYNRGFGVVQMNIWVSEIIYNLCFSKIIYRNNSTE